MKNVRSYGLIFLGLSIMLILSLGGGLWGEQQSTAPSTPMLFEIICYHDPVRSFSFKGTPMAVNSRCFGIFSGLWAGWLMIPVFIRFTIKKNRTNWLLLLAVMLQIIDYMGNHILWENSNISRAVLGLLLGITVAIFLSDLFKHKRKISES
jgi:uncharacterized membrane protein